MNVVYRLWWEYFLLFQAKCSRPEFVFCRLCTPVLEFGGLENVCNLWIIVWNHFPKQVLWLSHNYTNKVRAICAHFCLWWLNYIHIFFSRIRWLFMLIRVFPICNWELYVFKNLFSVILNSRRAFQAWCVTYHLATFWIISKSLTGMTSISTVLSARHILSWPEGKLGKN